MDNEQRVREMERASVERWFAPSPLGALFDAGDGRMLQIGVDAIEAARAEAFAIIDRFIVDSRPPPRWAVFGVIFAFTCALLALQPLLWLGGAAIGGIVMGGLILWHADDLLRPLRYRRDLKSLRARTALALGARSAPRRSRRALSPAQSVADPLPYLGVGRGRARFALGAFRRSRFDRDRDFPARARRGRDRLAALLVRAPRRSRAGDRDIGIARDTAYLAR